MRILFLFLFIFYSSFCYATLNEHSKNAKDKYQYKTYAGLTFGYGATTWGYLVTPYEEDKIIMDLYTPIEVSENGTLWGFFLGYEFNPSFALEASYMHYPMAKLYYYPESIFTYTKDGLSEFVSHTQSIALLGKFMIQIPHNTDFRAYSSVGLAGVHRDDIVNNAWAMSPNFGVGITYLITERIMAEFGIVYTAGDAVSELSPAEDFIPFLYSGFIRLALRV